MDACERDAFLAYAQLPKFQRKVDKALEVIREALAIGPAYVSVSWGKDSVVMLHLCQQIQPDILTFFSDGFFMDSYDNFTEVMDEYCYEYPTNLIVDRQSKTEAITGYNSPMAVVAAKRTESLPPVVFLGLRIEESRNRRMSLLKYGPIHQYKSGNHRACPLSTWKAPDIWAYTCHCNLPYLKSYDNHIGGRLGYNSRTTPHTTPLPPQTELGAKVKEHLALQSIEFRNLLKEFKSGKF